MSERSVNILGATGSIGQAAADVIAANADLFDVRLITANHNESALLDLKKRLGAQNAILLSKEGETALLQSLSKPVDITIAAIVGMAGLKPLLRAIQNSDTVLIANKEPLVAAGELILKAARDNNTRILPLDSEHNAIFQVLDPRQKDSVEKVYLTASGGPFLHKTAADLKSVTVEQALAHPTWQMGAKISIDSATMMNKAFEIIEAHILFDLPPEKIRVLIHPQSLIHAMVEYSDGSVLSHMGPSDMRTSLAHALGWPERISSPGRKMSLAEGVSLELAPPDFEQFPALALAYQAMSSGQAARIAMNAANEVSVQAFLDRQIGFCDIMTVVDTVVSKAMSSDNPQQTFKDLQGVLDYDDTIRRETAVELSNVISAAKGDLKQTG